MKEKILLIGFILILSACIKIEVPASTTTMEVATTTQENLATTTSFATTTTPEPTTTTMIDEIWITNIQTPGGKLYAHYPKDQYSDEVLEGFFDNEKFIYKYGDLCEDGKLKFSSLRFRYQLNHDLDSPEIKKLMDAPEDMCETRKVIFDW